MEFKPSPKLRTMYSLINILSFVAYCVVPVVVLQIIKQHPRHLYDIWSFVIGVLGLIVFILIQLYLPAYVKTLKYDLSSEDLRVQSGVFWRSPTSIHSRDRSSGVLAWAT